MAEFTRICNVPILDVIPVAKEREVNESKHTPGPWEVSPMFNGGLCVYSVLGRPTSEEAAANARLIAAATDLLAACEEFVRKCECGEAKSTRSYEQMKAAIAKAKGESDADR